MKTLIAVVLLLSSIFIPSLARAKSPNEMTVLDCYLLLPKDFLGTAPSHWLPQCKAVDEKNGFMFCMGDEEAQPDFQVALFRYADGHPMLAVCQGQLHGNEARFLDFFELNSQGQMQMLPRSIFPVADADEDKGANWYFRLPREGHTVSVRDQATGNVRQKISWNGEKFVVEK